jgi:hypothetical protein
MGIFKAAKGFQEVLMGSPKREFMSARQYEPISAVLKGFIRDGKAKSKEPYRLSKKCNNHT